MRKHIAMLTPLTLGAATKIYNNPIGDSRKLYALEALVGEAYLGTWCWGERDPNPHGPASKILLQAFDEFAGSVYTRLMSQTRLKPLFDSLGMSWDTGARLILAANDAEGRKEGGVMGFVILLALGLYLLISLGVVAWAVGHAKKSGRSAKKWGWAAALVMYLIPFWDWLPTVAVHQYYCAKDSGFWVYKTLDQWKAENPGGMEMLVVKEILTPSKHEGDEDNWTNIYLLNQRINQVSKHQGPLPFYRWKYEVAVVDSKTNKVLARSVDFYTTQVRSGGGWHGWKFWLATEHCVSHQKSAIQFGNYIDEFKGVKK